MEKDSEYKVAAFSLIVGVCFAILIGPWVLIPFGIFFCVSVCFNICSKNNESMQGITLSTPMEAVEEVDAVETVEAVPGSNQNGIAFIQVDNPPAYNNVAFGSPAPSYKSHMLPLRSTSPTPSYKGDMLDQHPTTPSYKSDMLDQHPTTPSYKNDMLDQHPTTPSYKLWPLWLEPIPPLKNTLEKI